MTTISRCPKCGGPMPNSGTLSLGYGGDVPWWYCRACDLVFLASNLGLSDQDRGGLKQFIRKMRRT